VDKAVLPRYYRCPRAETYRGYQQIAASNRRIWQAVNEERTQGQVSGRAPSFLNKNTIGHDRQGPAQRFERVAD
jgi:hypothetical protein